MNASTTQDPSLEVIKLLWMLINKHASDLNEGKLINDFVSKYNGTAQATSCPVVCRPDAVNTCIWCVFIG